METAAIVRQRVLDVDDNGVSPVGSNDWSRHLVVDEVAFDESVAIRVTCCVGNLKVVRTSDLSCGRVLQVKVCLDAVAIAPTLTGVWTIGTSGVSYQ